MNAVRLTAEGEIMRWTVPVALVGVLLLAGCAGERVGAGVSASASATPTSTASATASATPRPTSSATAGPTTTATPVPTLSPDPTPSPTEAPPAATPLENAVAACTTWQTSLGQDAATFPSTQASAAALIAQAAAADPAWQPLSADMSGLVAIGTDTSAGAVQQGQQLFTDLSTRCGQIGVTVTAG